MNTSKSQKAINLLNEIKDYPVFKDYTLIGGTALAVYLNHRESEDLDFITQNEKLNKVGINFFINSLEKRSFNIKKIYDEAGYIDFAEGGENIDDYQQIYEINGVNISFFVISDLTVRNILSKDVPNIIAGNIKAAQIDTIFKLKCDIISQRNKLRDYYDIYYLIKNKKCNLKETYLSIIKTSGNSFANHIIKNMYDLNVSPADKEGLLTLEKVNITVDELRDFFRKEIEKIYKQIINPKTMEKEDAFTKGLNDRLNKGKDNGWKR
ncbi:MAG: nucleotidyl transferase AbiEii/AbiGii toxin family protein [Candidatus Acidulodesulfobacterium sp.]